MFITNVFRLWRFAMSANGCRQGSFSNLPMSRWGYRRYCSTPRPPSLRVTIRPGIICGPIRFRLCISAWRSPASARISHRETCRRRGFGDGSPCSAARWRCPHPRTRSRSQMLELELSGFNSLHKCSASFPSIAASILPKRCSRSE